MKISGVNFLKILQSMYNSGRVMNIKERMLKEHNYTYSKKDDNWHSISNSSRISGLYVRNLTKEALIHMIKMTEESNGINLNSTLDMRI